MKYLPYENFCITTKLKPAEVQQRLEKEVSTRPGSFFSFGSREISTYFEGYAINGRFEFERDIKYRNSFLPKITGNTEPWLSGSRVHVKMRMPLAVIVFMCVWLIGAAFGGIIILLAALNTGHTGIVMFAGFGFFLFGYLLMMGGFKRESRDAKKKLLEMLDGEVE